jgi:hypothetical protein
VKGKLDYNTAAPTVETKERADKGKEKNNIRTRLRKVERNERENYIATLSPLKIMTSVTKSCLRAEVLHFMWQESKAETKCLQLLGVLCRLGDPRGAVDPTTRQEKMWREQGAYKNLLLATLSLRHERISRDGQQGECETHKSCCFISKL